MLNREEITAIIVASLIIGFATSLVTSTKLFIYSTLAIFLVIIVNLVAKKVSGYYLESEVETRLWDVKRYGFATHKYFKRPFPMGAFLPLITTAATLGFVTWTASLVFDVKA